VVAMSAVHGLELAYREEAAREADESDKDHD
jgi:hypothetical protein